MRAERLAWAESRDVAAEQKAAGREPGGATRSGDPMHAAKMIFATQDGARTLETVHDNVFWAGSAARLSIVIPSYRQRCVEPDRPAGALRGVSSRGNHRL